MGYPPPALPRRFNFARHVLRINTGRAAKAAFIDDHVTLRYSALDARVRRCAAGLLAQGVRREERILLVMHDTVDLPVAFLGALLAGVIPVPVNTLLPASDYRYMIAHSGARMIVVSAALLPCIREALAQDDEGVVARPAQAPQVVVADAVAAGVAATETTATAAAAAAAAAAVAAATTAAVKRTDVPPEPLSFSALLAAEPLADADIADTDADDIAFWLYSSGSTGRPKGTVHTHANPYWTAELYGKPVLGIGCDDVVFSAAKLFFAYGLGNGLTFPLCAGATTLLMAERPTPQAVCARLVSHRPTVFCGVPTLYVGLLASDALPPRDQVALRVCASAGEALPREVGNRFKAHFGCDILDGLGSTEMLHIFISNRAGAVRYGSSGQAVPGYEVRLADDDGQPVPLGTIGDLYVRGPSAALLYWTNREKSAATFQGDWVRTGDKYSADADGYYTYAGRGDDMLKVSGQYVSPIEVEGVLMAHASVSECAVVGRTGADGLTRTQAYVVPAKGQSAGDALVEALRQFVKSRLAPHKCPREFVFVDDLPKTATGKIQRFKLRALSEAGDGTPR